jgi:hypothetical protein
MLNAPKPIVIFINGDRGVWRKTQRRNYDPPAKSKQPPWLKQTIPQVDRPSCAAGSRRCSRQPAASERSCWPLGAPC